MNATRDGGEGGARGGAARARDRHLPEADHAFFNDTGARYNAAAAAEAWRRVLDWFDDAGDHDHDHHR